VCRRSTRLFARRSTRATTTSRRVWRASGTCAGSTTTRGTVCRLWLKSSTTTCDGIVLYTILQLPIYYGVWQTRGVRWGVVYCAIDVQSYCNSAGNAEGRSQREGNKRDDYFGLWRGEAAVPRWCALWAVSAVLSLCGGEGEGVLGLAQAQDTLSGVVSIYHHIIFLRPVIKWKDVGVSVLVLETPRI